jgi:O-succinylbenzoic acid--CoA ligase
MRPVVDWLYHRAQLTPQAPALIENKSTWTYAELNQKTARWCARLTQAGVKPQYRVAVLMSNSADYITIIHTLLRLKAVLVPLNLRLSKEELKHQIRHVQCGFLIYDAGMETQANQLIEHGLRIFSIDELQNLSIDAEDQWTSDDLDLDALGTLVFTSGTTSQPKAVRLTLGNHFWSTTASAFRLGYRQDDVWLLCMPLFHVGGLAIVIRACLYGNAIVVHPRFELDAVAQSVQENNITMLSLVPTMLHRLMPEWRQHPPTSLRCLLMGGAAMQTQLLQDALDLGLPIATTYGLTEASSQVATLPPSRVGEKPGSVGQPLRWSEVKIVDGTGQTLVAGNIGEITVHGPSVMDGYERNPNATNASFQDGWLHTGDLGYLDSGGDLWVVNRRTDLIISGGENVYPAEVEVVLMEHPDVAEACVVGIPDDEWGQCVTALVVARPDSTLDETELENFASEKLPGYKRPLYFKFESELPRNATGKVDRAHVLKLFV